MTKCSKCGEPLPEDVASPREIEEKGTERTCSGCQVISDLGAAAQLMGPVRVEERKKLANELAAGLEQVRQFLIREGLDHRFSWTLCMAVHDDPSGPDQSLCGMSGNVGHESSISTTMIRMMSDHLRAYSRSGGRHETNVQLTHAVRMISDACEPGQLGYFLAILESDGNPRQCSASADMGPPQFDGVMKSLLGLWNQLAESREGDN